MHANGKIFTPLRVQKFLGTTKEQLVLKFCSFAAYHKCSHFPTDFRVDHFGRRGSEIDFGEVYTLFNGPLHYNLK